MSTERVAGTAAKALSEFAAGVRDMFGDRVVAILLFGSAARGERNEESDLDVAVVVEGLSYAEGTACAHLAGDLLTKYDVIISPFAVSAERMNVLRSRERLIAAEIDRDGIAL